MSTPARKPGRFENETDEAYLVRSLTLYVDEIRRRQATKHASTLRLGVKVDEGGNIVSIMAFIEDCFRRL